MPYLANCRTVYTCALEGAQGDLHPIPEGTVAWRGETVGWVGRLADLPAEWRNEPPIDCGGGFALPGLIDCHTHLAFAGWRADEFVERLRGKSYLEIAEAGGGILSTVAKTRAATKEELVARCRDFIKKISALGVTTIECKSGYGLNLETELKLLEVYREIGDGEVSIVATFLGAHTVPKEHREERERYVDLVIETMLPAVAAKNLAVFCDVFVERSAFSPAEARRIFAAAKALGLGAKLHADQLTAGGGAELAAEVGAVSADHLEYASDAGIAALARSGVVAVMLPFASLYTREKPADARRFVHGGARVAVATDFNPGSAPSYHLPLALSLACTLNGLTPSEAVKGATSIAALALGRADTCGALTTGKRADIAVIDSPDPDTWLYHIEANRCSRVIKSGVELPR
jgi:imidazolonepropionase